MPLTFRKRKKSKDSMPPTGPGSEHSIQAKFFGIIRKIPCREARLTRAIPNGFLRTKSMRLRAWREGVLAGTLDVLCCVPRHGYHGLWIEVKRPGQKLSDEQLEFARDVAEEGYLVVRCDTVEDLLETWCKYTGIKIQVRL